MQWRAIIIMFFHLSNRSQSAFDIWLLMMKINAITKSRTYGAKWREQDYQIVSSRKFQVYSSKITLS